MYQQTDPPRSPKEIFPTMYDLPSEEVEDAGLPDQYHLWQADLLEKTFCPPNYPRERIFVASDLNLYYDLRHPLWYKRPDWFAVIDVDRLYEQREARLSYVIWQEGVDPFIAVELLSPGTEKEDLGQSERKKQRIPTKWEVYEQILRIPYYVVFNRYTDQLRLFELVRNRYREIALSSTQFWLPEIKLGLGLWSGEYQDLSRNWLRWYDESGNWIPTPAEQQRQWAEQEHQRAEQEHQRAERLAERLRQLGITLDDI